MDERRRVEIRLDELAGELRGLLVLAVEDEGDGEMDGREGPLVACSCGRECEFREGMELVGACLAAGRSECRRQLVRRLEELVGTVGLPITRERGEGVMDELTRRARFSAASGVVRSSW